MSSDPAETHATFVEAAKRLFVERGIDAPTVQDICAAAGFSRGTFYTHFKDKEDVLAAVMDQIVSTFVVDELAVAETNDLSEIIRNYAARFVERTWIVAGSVGWGFHHTLEACARSERVRRAYSDAIDRMCQRVKVPIVTGQRDGRLRPNLDPDALAALLASAALGGVALAQVGVPVDAATVARTLCELLQGANGP
jgi:AcrR family transcriptional regulator